MPLEYVRRRSSDVAYPTSGQRGRLWGEGAGGPGGGSVASLIDDITWTRGWLFADADGSTGEVPEINGGTPLTLQASRTWTPGQSTAGSNGAFNAAGVGVGRVDEAVIGDGTSAYTWAAAGSAEFARTAGQDYHIRALYVDLASQPGGTATLLERRQGANYERTNVANSLGQAQLLNFDGGFASTVGSNANNGRLLLIDISVTGSTGQVVLRVNKAHTVNASGFGGGAVPGYAAPAVNVASTMAGNLLFVGWRNGVTISEAAHDAAFDEGVTV